MADKSKDAGGSSEPGVKVLNLANLIVQSKAIKGTCPLPTSIIYTPGDSYETFLSCNDIECKPSTAMSWAILVAGVTEFLKKLKAPEKTVANTLSPGYMSSIIEAAGKWFIELVFCYQTSPLNEKNFEAYFKSMGSETLPYKIDHIIDYLSRKVQKVSGVNGARELIEGSTFVKYHTSASSTASLMERAIASSPFTDAFKGNEIAAMKEAARDPTNLDLAQKIPLRALVMTSAILVACEQLPRDWYMGAKAVNTYPAAKYSSLVKVIKRGIDVGNGVAGVDTMTSMEDLKNKFAALSGAEVVEAPTGP